MWGIERTQILLGANSDIALDVVAGYCHYSTTNTAAILQYVYNI